MSEAGGYIKSLAETYWHQYYHIEHFVAGMTDNHTVRDQQITLKSRRRVAAHRCEYLERLTLRFMS